MKKIFLLIIPFVFLSTLTAQITQEKADEIVLERINQETQTYIVYAKEDVQTEMTITTANGEILELDYSSWVYYMSYTEGGRYLIVNESNGNVLEVNTTSDASPNDLTAWRVVYPIEEPFLTVDETPIAATAAAGMYSIAVSSNGAWTAVVEDAKNHAWCTLTGASGTNTGVITVNVAENPFFTARSATVKITVGDLTKYVVITQEGANTEPCTLANTWWKCEGIVNVETGVLTEFEAEKCNNFIKDCEKVCYTLTFDPNNVVPVYFDGRGVSNTFFGQCEIDCTTNNFQVVMYGMSSVAPHCDEKLYFESLFFKVNKFSIQANKLRLYYDEHNYLRFKPLVP